MPDVIEIGDEVIYSPNNPKYEDAVTGFVADTVLGHGGDTGFEVLCPLPGDPTRTLRLWASRGTFTRTGKVADWKKPPDVKAAAPPVSSAAPLYHKPYRNAADLVVLYKTKGFSRQQAWNEFVKDTILGPFRSESLDAKDIYEIYDRVSDG